VGAVEHQLLGPIGGVVAVPLAVLRFPIVLGERPSGILAAVSPRAALVAVSYGHRVRSARRSARGTAAGQFLVRLSRN
jgi:hypothetical protein